MDREQKPAKLFMIASEVITDSTFLIPYLHQNGVNGFHTPYSWRCL